MAAPKELRAQLLSGVAEADETYFLRSANGQRGPSGERAPVLVARDFILQVVDSAHAAQKLAPIMATDVILRTEADLVMQTAARKLGMTHHAVNVAAGRRAVGLWHVQNIT